MDWNSLAVAPCVLISTANAFCYRVTGYGGYLVVGLGVIPLSGQRRRRLLDFSQEDLQGMPLEQQVEMLQPWNQTASPCNLLAQYAPKLTSITDVQSLKKCIHWRMVGRQTLNRLNMTSTASDDSLLLSWTDFARVLGSNSRLMLSVAKNLPILLLIVLKESGFFSITGTLWKTASHSALMRAWVHSLDIIPQKLTNSTNATLSIYRHPDYAMRLFQGEAFSFLESHILAMDHSTKAAEMADEFLAQTANSSEWLQKRVNMTLLLAQIEDDMTQKNGSLQQEILAENGSSRRRLLQQGDSFEEEQRFVQVYSGWISNTKGFSNLQIGKSKLTDNWLEGPLLWPPVFNHLADSRLDCEAADETVSAVLQVSGVLKQYFTSEEYLHTVNMPPWGIGQNMPTIHMSKKLKNANSSFVQATPR